MWALFYLKLFLFVKIRELLDVAELGAALRKHDLWESSENCVSFAEI
jgi:hypothetical protein